jgi:predicted small metal-binding protein
MECNLCGQVLQADSDDELVQAATSHMEADHADAQVGEDGVRELVERNAYTATDA